MEIYHVFCTNIDVTKANLTFHLLQMYYGKRWNIENFYRDNDSNFMMKQKLLISSRGIFSSVYIYIIL